MNEYRKLCLRDLQELAKRLENDQPHLSIVFEDSHPIVRGEW